MTISLLGAQGKKEENISKRSIVANFAIGGFLSLGVVLFRLKDSTQFIAIIYMTITGQGFLLILAGGNILSRLIKLSFTNDVFNSLNENFPQQENLLLNEYSINLPARYNLKGKLRKSWINIINPFRGLLVIGSPGSGKSWFVRFFFAETRILTVYKSNSLIEPSGSGKIEPIVYLLVLLSASS